MDDSAAGSYITFLKHLDSEEISASEKYLTLRLKLTKSLVWKGCPEFEADNLADKVLDLVSKKVNEIEAKLEKGITNENGKEIKKIENINAYAGEVVRLVWLEHYRKHLKNRVDNENSLILTVQPEEDAADETDVRVRCLRKCIAEKIPDEKDKQLILGYYDDESDEKNKIIRENLREKLGLSKANFKTKACRLRERLEKCINECVEKINKNHGVSG